MGAWGVNVMENDRVLDTMYEIVGRTDFSEVVRDLIDSSYVEKQLLGVEMVDISLNGIDETILGCLYDYEEFFNKVSKNPMNDLLGLAKETLFKIKKKDCGWVPSAVRERNRLLDKIEKRLG